MAKQGLKKQNIERLTTSAQSEIIASLFFVKFTKWLASDIWKSLFPGAQHVISRVSMVPAKTRLEYCIKAFNHVVYIYILQPLQQEYEAGTGGASQRDIW